MTVNDVPKQPCFEGAAWVAGRQGADRVVRWVHVGEIPNLSEYLEGGELILSTGMCLGDPLLGPKFVGGLIEVGAAGLAVELGQYVVDIPPALARLADAHAFPIIAFPHPVRFRDLSYDLNNLLLNQHYQALAQLERLSTRLQHSLLRTEGVAALVDILHQTLRTAVCYRPHQPEEPSVVCGEWDVEMPPPPAPVHPKPTPLGAPPSALHQSVIVFGHPGSRFVRRDPKPRGGRDPVFGSRPHRERGRPGISPAGSTRPRRPRRRCCPPGAGTLLAAFAQGPTPI